MAIDIEHPESGGRRPEPVSVELAGGDALMMLTRPRATRVRGTAVLLCPPFGWQEVCAYRGLRTWADALAAAGYPAGRLTLPSTGDSAGDPGDPGRVGAWTGAVSAAADRLRLLTGCRRVAAIGIELGGLIAGRAQTAGAAIDDLILWDVSARGRAQVRELRMFAGIVAALHPEDVRDEDAEELNLSGYPMSAETAAALCATHLDDPAPRGGAARRVLLLGRDGTPPDPRLQPLYEQSGATVEVADGDGYDALMAPPQQSQAPRETILTTIAWLDRGPDESPGSAGSPPSAELRCGVAGGVRETPIWFTGSHGKLFGVLSEPADGSWARTCVVLVNSGGIVHSGPNRLWVDLGRRWALRGIPCLRIDLAGVGESDGDDPDLLKAPSLHADWREREIQGVLDQLCERGVAEHFVLGGACSGAYIALRVGVADPRVMGLALINLGAFSWSTELILERLVRDAVTLAVGRVISRSTPSQPVDAELWALATRDPRGAGAASTMTRHERLMRAARHARPDRAGKVLTQSMQRRERARTREAFTALEQRGAKTMLFFSSEEQLLRQLERQGFVDRLGDWPGLTLEVGGSRDPMYRARWARQEVECALDAAVQRVVDSVPRMVAAPADGQPAIVR